MARFNRVVTNRVFAPLAGRVPPWALVEHIGRRSGRRYRTVVWAFPRPREREFVYVLTYGPGADWVRNVLAAGTCRVLWLGRWRPFSSVMLVEGKPALRLLPAVLRLPLWVAGMHWVLRVRE